MKKLPFLILLTLTFVWAACKKDPVETEPCDLSLLTNKWEVVSPQLGFGSPTYSTVGRHYFFTPDQLHTYEWKYESCSDTTYVEVWSAPYVKDGCTLTVYDDPNYGTYIFEFIELTPYYFTAIIDGVETKCEVVE